MKQLFYSLRSRIVVITALLAVMGVTLFAAVPETHAINVFKNGDPDQSAAAGVVTNDGNTKTDFQTIMQRVLSILFIIIGVLSVIMIIVGGLRYTLANGDQAALKSAKNTILYAVVGLVISILAVAIVNFVVAWFSKK